MPVEFLTAEQRNRYREGEMRYNWLCCKKEADLLKLAKRAKGAS